MLGSRLLLAVILKLREGLLAPIILPLDHRGVGCGSFVALLKRTRNGLSDCHHVETHMIYEYKYMYHNDDNRIERPSRVLSRSIMSEPHNTVYTWLARHLPIGVHLPSAPTLY